MTYLNDLVATKELIDVLSWSAVEQETGKVERALPCLEAAFVDTASDVRGADIVQYVVIVRVIFGHKLHSDIVQFAAWQYERPTYRRLDMYGTVAQSVWQSAELSDD